MTPQTRPLDGITVVSEPIDGSGSTLWAGLKYHWTLGGDDQWAVGKWTGTGGINFRLDDAWVIGVFGGYEQSGMTLAALDRSFDGSGGSLGVSAAYRFDDWRLELLGYGSRLSYDLADGDTTASFGACNTGQTFGGSGGGGDTTAPSITATTPASGASDFPAAGDLSVSFSEAVTLANGAFALQCATSGAVTLDHASTGSTFAVPEPASRVWI